MDSFLVMADSYTIDAILTDFEYTFLSVFDVPYSLLLILLDKNVIYS